LQRSASTLLSLICFQETSQAQDNIDLLKGTHFFYTLLTVLSLYVKQYIYIYCLIVTLIIDFFFNLMGFLIWLIICYFFGC
jgi:hypothetical protein